MAPNTIPIPALLHVDALARQVSDRYRFQPQGNLLLGRDHERGEEASSEGAEAGETRAYDGDVGFDDPGETVSCRSGWKKGQEGKHTTKGS